MRHCAKVCGRSFGCGGIQLSVACVDLKGHKRIIRCMQNDSARGKRETLLANRCTHFSGKSIAVKFILTLVWTELMAITYLQFMCGGYSPGYPGLAATQGPGPLHVMSLYNQSHSETIYAFLLINFVAVLQMIHRFVCLRFFLNILVYK